MPTVTQSFLFIKKIRARSRNGSLYLGAVIRPDTYWRWMLELFFVLLVVLVGWSYFVLIRTEREVYTVEAIPLVAQETISRKAFEPAFQYFDIQNKEFDYLLNKEGTVPDPRVRR